MKPKFKNGEDVYYVLEAKLIETVVDGPPEWGDGHMKSQEGDVFHYKGWVYPMGESHDDEFKYALESSLRKRPQPGEFSFDEIMNQLKQPIQSIERKKSLTEQ